MVILHLFYTDYSFVIPAKAIILGNPAFFLRSRVKTGMTNVVEF